MRNTWTTGRPRPFVGREAELAALHRALASARDAERPIILIAGEPGIGKTHLLQEAGNAAEAEGWSVLVGHAYDSDGMPPYLPFIEPLKQYTRTCSAELLEAQLGEGHADIALLLPELRRIYPDVPAPPASEPASDRYRLFESVSEFIESIARAAPIGLVLCLEDLHWADDSSLLLLEHLARRPAAAPLVLIGTYRDTEFNPSGSLARTLEHLVRQSPLQQIALTRLDRDEIAAMLAGVGQVEPPRALTEAIVAETEGNPFFVQEVLDYLAGEGRLFNPDGSWRSDLEIDERDVPRGVRLVIGRRLEMLSDRCRRVLAAASVTGRSIDYEVLRDIADLDEADLLDSLDEARRKNLLAPETGAGLSFNHELVRQTILADLTPPRRQGLHLRIAECLEARHESNLKPHLADIAAHYRATSALNPEKAINASRDAGDEAMRVYAWQEAVVHYDGALHVTKRSQKDDARHCDLLLALGESLLAAGERRRILEEVAPAALALAEALGDSTRAFAACRLVLVDAVDDFPPVWLDTADRYVDDDAQGRIMLNIRKSGLRLHSGRYAETRALLLEALALARGIEDAGAELRVATSLMRHGVLSAEEERHLSEETREIPRERATGRDRAEAGLQAVMNHLQSGERAQAEVERHELAKFASQSRLHRAVVRSCQAEALFASMDGHLSEALEAAQAAEGGSFPHVWRGRLAAWLGDTAALEHELAWSKRFPGSRVITDFSAFFLACLGRMDKVHEVLHGLPDIVARAPQDIVCFGAMAVLLEAASISADRAVAEAFAGSSGDPRRLSQPTFVLVPRHLGRLATLLGRHDEARGLYHEAIDFCESISYRPELALTHLDLADVLLRYYPQERAEARERLDLAIPEFQSMGMRPSLELATALRARLDGSSGKPSDRSGLSDRELEVLRLVAAGKSNQQIADALVISGSTVAKHVSSILSKTGAANRTEAATYAHQHDLT